MAKNTENLSKLRVWDKVPERSTLIFGDTQIPSQYNEGQAEGSLCAKIRSIRSAVLLEHQFVTDDGWTEGHSMYRASTASHG